MPGVLGSVGWKQVELEELSSWLWDKTGEVTSVFSGGEHRADDDLAAKFGYNIVILT